MKKSRRQIPQALFISSTKSFLRLNVTKNIWRRPQPLDKMDGVAILNLAYGTAPRDVQKALKEARDKAEQWINSRDNDGVKGYYSDSWSGSCGYRVDVEVGRGKAFTTYTWI